jgi:ribonuclease BN (tRNA processing enzyme)
MGLTLTVLGTSTPYPRPDQPCSGYLVRSPTAALWADAGTGTFAELQRYMDPECLDAIWISHMHPDHAGDLPAVANWLINRQGKATPLPMYGPPGWLARLSAFLPTDPALLAKYVDAHDLVDGHHVAIGGLQLFSHAVQHGVPAFGLRVTYEDRVLAYSGDSGPCDALLALAKETSLFLCEAGTADQLPGSNPGHCTPEDAARMADEADSARLLLTHFAPDLDPVEALQRASLRHPNVEVAAQGREYRI